MDGRTVDRSELVDIVLDADATTGETVSQDTKQRLEIDLHHTQLPRLADAGLIEYDPRQGTVRYDG